MISDNPIKYQVNPIQTVSNSFCSAQTVVFWEFSPPNPKKSKHRGPLTSARPAGSSGGFRSDPPSARTAHRFAPRTRRGRWRSRCRPGGFWSWPLGFQRNPGKRRIFTGHPLFTENINCSDCFRESMRIRNYVKSRSITFLREFIIVYPFNKSNIIRDHNNHRKIRKPMGLQVPLGLFGDGGFYCARGLSFFLYIAHRTSNWKARNRAELGILYPS